MVTVGWLAVALARAEWHPGWGVYLSGLGAAADTACAVALRARQWVAWAGEKRERRARKQDAERRLCELETLVGGLSETLLTALRHAEVSLRPDSRPVHLVPPAGEP
jgi:hypothetical protein